MFRLNLSRVVSFALVMLFISDLARAAAPVGRFFLVEQPSAKLNSTWLNVNDVSRPGGLVFWNSSKDDYSVIQSTIAKYSSKAKERGDDPWLFSIDYEGGALNKTPSGKTVPGIQRFTKGLTPLAHPIWLGKSLQKFGGELCELHGKIMGRELSAIGVNYPLTVVADLAKRLFSVRGVSKDPNQVTLCLKSFMLGMSEADSVIVVTKHFPGLGQTVGDTHDGVSRSVAANRAEFDLHLQPFKEIIEFVNAKRLDSKLSILSSHGLFPQVDPEQLTTESSLLLTDLLVNQLGFNGIRVSDAMWMGDYEKLTGNHLNAVYISAFLAGTDLLMIPGSKYKTALQAFQDLSENRVSPDLERILTNKLKTSINIIQEKFMTRIDESLRRLRSTQGDLRHAADTIIANKEPTNLTQNERQRYFAILSELGYNSLKANTEVIP